MPLVRFLVVWLTRDRSACPLHGALLHAVFDYMFADACYFKDGRSDINDMTKLGARLVLCRDSFLANELWFRYVFRPSGRRLAWFTDMEYP